LQGVGLRSRIGKSKEIVAVVGVRPQFRRQTC
jgi:hypothetical protein